MNNFPSAADNKFLIERARDEDLGQAGDDVTSRICISDGTIGRGLLVQKQPGVIAGLPIVEQVCAVYDRELVVRPIGVATVPQLDGVYRDSNVTPLVRIEGPLRSLLAAERVLLNFVQHLSGIATLTRQYVEQLVGTKAVLVDTRKTTPGYRDLEKYAVRCGGGANHRQGLHDMVLIKDNHLASYEVAHLTEAIASVVTRSRQEDPDRLIEVEVDTLEQLAAVLKVRGVDIILLDNMSPTLLTEAVVARRSAGREGQLLLEASGNVTLSTIRDIALTGVDRISVGSVTHSAPSLDVGLDIERT